MAQKMIINARQQLSLRRRIVSDLATALIWGGWLLMWLPLFRKLGLAIALHRYFGPETIEVLHAITPIALPRALVALVGTSVLLMLWSLLPSRRLTHDHAVQALADYAEHFGLDEAVLRAGQHSRICIVRHDEHGEIVAIESRA